MDRYKIVGPFCGRDNEGVFHCICGKCKKSGLNVNENGYDSGNNGGDGRNNGYGNTPPESSAVSSVF